MAAKRTKVLAPLAVLVVAGGITLQSGATFTSQSDNSINAVTSGTLTQSNSKDGQAIFNLTDLKPGDTLNGTLTLTNTGSLPASFGLTEVTSTSTFAAEALSLTITDTTNGTEVYSGTFGGLTDGARNELGVFQPSDATTYRFTVQMSPDAGNSQQGKVAQASYRWDSVQLDGTSVDQ
ncbi:TasA family protein [Cellulomonas bogoriensis]|uniref:Camelysin-like metallo-endopeptidase n=1 Tax=Cellulomonas bogoriensis 69B4 = DSM 16987 TaxID=1386082 RepID=A0A0A0C236_9CELL|nr:TasA family protein [Cellulomonas bogoriensis]KGM14221.1 hypothetical protein N869_01420 [Cellulomonas bogoriensis 69B4 = DSM 16987]